MDFVAEFSNNFDFSTRLLLNFDCHLFDRQVLAETEKTKLGHYHPFNIPAHLTGANA
jgi:hypothetical protein